MRLLSALVLLAAPLALGQPGINPTQNLVQFGVRETPTAQTDVITIGASACGTSRIVYWVWNQFGVQPCNNMRVWATSQESCGTEPKSGDKEYDSVNALLVSSLRQGAITINIDELPVFAAGATRCGSAITKNVDHRVCAAVPASIQCFGLQNPQTQTASALRIVYDVEAPPAPVISAVGELDKGLRVSVSASSDTVEIVPLIREQGATEYSERSRVALTGSKEVVVDGLLNGTTYDVRLRAVDAAGNVSPDSEAAAGTPRRVIGFFGQYRDAGGREPGGGCQAAPALLVPLLALLAFSRRRRS
ncbi:MAG: fibronectin type III domain-containing protein [Myxococcaceae bacterium]|nr:fibronectin type III domain-containing protein [Myxococcaceae bacterium]MCA3015284.1 fibronectin type III domain-containing protein [Myxococcaceae bacterium]